MTLTEKLWNYQAERFPLIQTVPLLALFSAAAINVSAFLAGRDLPGFTAYLAGFLLAMILFFQMRVADEHKDYEDDLRYRPERPVQRGLISLALLARIASGLGLLAIVIAFTRPVPTAICLLLTWGWFMLMTREFFAPDWLKARPVLYLVSHMAILPLIDLMLTSLEWAGHGAAHGLWVFLAVSFVNGCVLEIGRKTWAPENEREGVETYSRLWGPGQSALIWLSFVAGAAVLLVALGALLGLGRLFAVVALLGLVGAGLVAMRFRAGPDAARQKQLDLAAGLWVALSYATCGFLPLVEGTP